MAAASSNEDEQPTSSNRMDQEGPWTMEDLQDMADEEVRDREEALGGAWREHFDDDPSNLVEYADRAYEEFSDTQGRLKSLSDNEYEEIGAWALEDEIPAAVSSDIIGMGTWRIRKKIDPVIEALVGRLEGSFRELLEDDLNIYPISEWKQKGLDWCDSMDPERELEGWSDGDIPDPSKGEEGYPRLLIENRIYCSRVFRKMHIEVAWRQDGLHILHLVLFPRVKFDLPIFCMDLVVSSGGRVTLAIVDSSPVTRNQRLPAHYMKTMHELQEMLLTDPSNQRQVPEWGKAIFSPLCVCMTPKDGLELAGFMKYAVALQRAHIMLASLLQPVEEGSSKHKELLEAHSLFVEKQLENKKTLRVLEQGFGTEWSTRYMQDLMFDFNPDKEPAYVDGSVFRLYDYYEENPEMGDFEEEVMRVKNKSDYERAEEYLDELLRAPPAPSNPFRPTGVKAKSDDDDEEDRPGPLSSASSVSRQRAEWSLTKLYQTDEGFRESVDALLPDAWERLEEGSLGEILVEQMRGALAGDEGDS